MSQLKLVIVDDEKRARTSIKNILNIYCPDVTVVAEANNIERAFEAIKFHNPDVVLLDIKMPGGTGFDLLKQINPINFKIIFITAFNEFAVQAIRCSALDYILKPVFPEDLVNALQRVEMHVNNESFMSKLSVFMDNMYGLTNDTKKIVLNSHDKILVVGLNEIVRCEADSNYTHFILLNKKAILVSHSLKEYEEMLSSVGFFRPHNSHLINLSFIDRLEKRDGGILIMKDGSSVPVSTRKYSELINLLNSKKFI